MKNCILRGKILKLLSELYPNGIDRSTLVGIYYQYDKVDDIEKSLEYLRDKNFIVRKENPHPYKENKKVIFYKITPEGVDLIEGNIPEEPGIVIPAEA